MEFTPVQPNVNIYKLHYTINEIGPLLEMIAEKLTERLDISNSTLLLQKREDLRLLLPVMSKCFLSVDYRVKKLGLKSGEEYALLSSLREYCEMIKKDLESTLFTIANTINYYRQER